MSFGFSGTNMIAGQQDALENTENEVWWGTKPDNIVRRGSIILSSAVDAGNTPTTILRPGLIMGGPNAAEKIKEWAPTAADGTENIYGILLREIDMLYAGVAADRHGPNIMVAGPLIAGKVLVPGEAANGLSGKANEYLFRRLVSNRFLMDDDISGVHSARAGLDYRQVRDIGAAEAAGDDAYQVLAADDNVLFTNLGEDASMAFTLPAIATVGPGFRVGLLVMVAQEVVLTSSDGSDIVCDNNLAGSTVTLTTANEELGRLLEVVAISATKWLCIVHGTHPTDAAAFTVA